MCLDAGAGGACRCGGKAGGEAGRVATLIAAELCQEPCDCGTVVQETEFFLQGGKAPGEAADRVFGEERGEHLGGVAQALAVLPEFVECGDGEAADVAAGAADVAETAVEGPGGEWPSWRTEGGGVVPRAQRCGGEGQGEGAEAGTGKFAVQDGVGGGAGAAGGAQHGSGTRVRFKGVGHRGTSAVQKDVPVAGAAEMGREVLGGCGEGGKGGGGDSVPENGEGGAKAPGRDAHLVNGLGAVHGGDAGGPVEDDGAEMLEHVGEGVADVLAGLEGRGAKGAGWGGASGEGMGFGGEAGQRDLGVDGGGQGAGEGVQRIAFQGEAAQLWPCGGTVQTALEEGERRPVPIQVAAGAGECGERGGGGRDFGPHQLAPVLLAEGASRKERVGDVEGTERPALAGDGEGEACGREREVGSVVPGDVNRVGGLGDNAGKAKERLGLTWGQGQFDPRGPGARRLGARRLGARGHRVSRPGGNVGR